MRGVCAAAVCGVVSVIAGVGGLANSADAQVFLRPQEVGNPGNVNNPFAQPLGAFAIPGDSNRLFVVQQGGLIRILNLAANTVSSTPFLNIGPTAANTADRLTAASGERGLLGFAFDPNYVQNGRYYVYYTTTGGTFFSRVDRFTAVGAPFANQAAAFAAATTNMASRVTLLEFQQDFANHNGGALVFGNDGMLYIGSGDGGSADDPFERSQNLATLLGKLLRLDVNDTSAADGDGLYIPDNNPYRSLGHPADKIWAYGLRNPWRVTVDRQTGDIWIGDVGQDAQEEINFQPALTAGNYSQVAGRNYGWDCREGLIATPNLDDPAGCDPNNPPSNPPGPVPYVNPIDVFLHAGGACSVTGGYVYRGSVFPELQGAYFTADYCGNFVKSFRYNGTTVTDERDWTSQVNGNLSPNPVQGLASLAEDADGELYVISINLGRIYKLVPDPDSCGCPCVVQPGRPLLVSDNFQTDMGWTPTAGAGVTAGAWQRGVPVNDPSWAYGPLADSDGSGNAWVTGNQPGNSDVDGGSVTLTSPLFDFTSGGITICFDYYLSMTEVGGANPDGLFFEVSSNNGGSWTRVASYLISNAQSWTPRVIQQSEMEALGLTMTSQMRVRFIASDNSSPNQSIVEAGIDNFKVYTVATITDCNGNGVDDAIDIAMATSADCNSNMIPDECDIAAALAAANTAGNPDLQIDLDGGLIGNRLAGQAFVGTNCFGCHAADGTGGTAPNIRNKTRTQIRQRLYLQLPHPGGGFPGSTAQDHADIEFFLADGGSKGRPDGIIDACQTGLLNCDADATPDGRELVRGLAVDRNYNGVPDNCECICDLNGGGLGVQDIFDFLAFYFSNDLRGDFNAVGGITVQDIFDFLQCYFSGCP